MTSVLGYRFSILESQLGPGPGEPEPLASGLQAALLCHNRAVRLTRLAPWLVALLTWAGCGGSSLDDVRDPLGIVDPDAYRVGDRIRLAYLSGFDSNDRAICLADSEDGLAFRSVGLAVDLRGRGTPLRVRRRHVAARTGCRLTRAERVSSIGSREGGSRAPEAREAAVRRYFSASRSCFAFSSSARWASLTLG